jgi:hypothetical protein
VPITVVIRDNILVVHRQTLEDPLTRLVAPNLVLATLDQQSWEPYFVHGGLLDSHDLGEILDLATHGHALRSQWII